MAYNSYLLKINSVAFPNAYLVVPSYQVPDEPIQVFSYYDANYNKHIETASQSNVKIEFTLRQLKAADYKTAVTALTGPLSIEYYDAKADTYKTGNFVRTSKLASSIFRIFNNDVWMNSEKITLERVL